MPEAFATAAISLQNLTKRFGAVTAVDDVSLPVESAALVCLLGPSGCGKTTTLRMIGGFEEPAAGRIFIGDEDVTSLPPYARPTAMVFQSYALFPHMTVYDNIAYGLRARRAAKDEIARRVQDALGLMELHGHEKKSPRSCPAGSSSGSRWRARSSSAPKSCCSTSRSPTSTPNCASACAARSAPCKSSWASPAYTSPTIRKRPSASPIRWR